MSTASTTNWRWVALVCDCWKNQRVSSGLLAKPLEKVYDWYSFKILPQLGKMVAGDDASYRYLAESIRMHPGQEELKSLMQQSGFGHVDYHNMTGGVVALHVGIKC